MRNFIIPENNDNIDHCDYEKNSDFQHYALGEMSSNKSNMAVTIFSSTFAVNSDVN